jgi:prefoldin subunit 5
MKKVEKIESEAEKTSKRVQKLLKQKKDIDQEIADLIKVKEDQRSYLKELTDRKAELAQEFDKLQGSQSGRQDERLALI